METQAYGDSMDKERKEKNSLKRTPEFSVGGALFSSNSCSPSLISDHQSPQWAMDNLEPCQEILILIKVPQTTYFGEFNNSSIQIGDSWSQRELDKNKSPKMINQRWTPDQWQLQNQANNN